jgi:hypothetical protein
MLKAAKEESQAMGSAQINAEFYLNAAAANPALAAKLAAKRQDGVTDEDIRWYWNLPDIERRMMDKSERTCQYAFCLSKTEEGLSPEQAARDVRKALVMWGDPTDTQNTQGDDRPLPRELHRRVVTWIEQYYTQPGALRAKAAPFSTYNAMIRAEIRAGRL